jgi:hypothetical protein
MAFNSFDNCRKCPQCQLDQFSVADISNSDPQDRWAIVACSPANGKVAILGNENCGTRNRFIPNLLIGSRQQTEVDNVNRFAAGLAQRLRQRGRKLRIDQKEQNLFRRNDGMVRLPGSKGQDRIEIRVFKVRIFPKNRLSRLAGRHQAQNVGDCNTQSADAGPAVHAIGIDRYSFQKL